MISGIFEYLIKNFVDFQAEAISNKTNSFFENMIERLKSEKDHAINEFINKLFDRSEEFKDKMIKQLTSLSFLTIGILLSGIGLSMIIDKLVNFSGAGFALIGIILLIGSMIVRK